MRNITITCLLIYVINILPVAAFEIEFEETFGDNNSVSTIQILSSTDSERFRPVINGFIKRNPELSVHYVTASTTEIYTAIAKENTTFDLVISSAMDLQMKLANDGFTKKVTLTGNGNVPNWARWRSEVFGFAQEPIVLLVSKQDFFDLKLPKTRRDLLALMRNNPDIFINRIGTYDPKISGAGYLFSTQDSRQSDTFWRLAEVMGRLNTKLYCCTSKMIEAVDSGELALAYNVLGSYANAELPLDSNAQVIALEDYTQILLRTAVVPLASKRPDLGTRFLDYLISVEGQDILDKLAKLPSLNNFEISKLANRKPIRLDSGLLVFLDKLKRSAFLREWDAALFQN